MPSIRPLIVERIVLLFCTVVIVNGHVALEYPPARRYALDYLDSLRTKPPCGMPKGDTAVSLLAGSSFNVTWKLGYPHQGGFRLEVLNATDDLQAVLTPGSVVGDFLIGDSTAQQYRVTLPPGVQCYNCTIRLVRQATEWGENYRLWSCADVDIVDSSQYKEDCSGHGRLTLRKCRCEKLYYGKRCQFKNDCYSDNQCGKFGKCVSLSSQSYPRKQCICKVGHFGRACEHLNPVGFREKPSSTSLYQTVKIAAEVDLYWRVLVELEELEVLVKARGTSYVALGWRPVNITAACKRFPALEPDKEADVEPATTTETGLEVTGIPTSSAAQPVEIKSSKSKRSAEDDQSDSTTERIIDTEPTTATPIPTTDNDIRKNATNSEAAPSMENKTITPSVPPKPEFHRRDGFYPGGELHPMDCSDVVIGQAVGGYGRVVDYYSRDRSTPREDEFYGGTPSLTAASAFEEDGITTVMFRRKLSASEPTDHTISAGPMEVIWALGQQAGDYQHHPPSGLETGSASVHNFYRPDHIKYHGSGPSKRGVAQVDFLQSGGKNSQQLSPDAYDFCGAEWRWPPSCSMDLQDCEYAVRWEYLQYSDQIRFTVQSAYRENWCGVGFSETPTMSSSDIVMAYVRGSGRVTLQDRWATGHLAPVNDQSQDISNITGSIENSRQQVTFVRKRDTKDSRDLAFTNSSCLYMLFPVSGGKYLTKWKRFNKHDSTPFVSSQKICITPCGTGPRIGKDGKVLPPPPPPNIEYDVRLHLRGLEKPIVAPDPSSDDYRVVSERIRRDMLEALQDIPGFKEAKVVRFIPNAEGLLVQLMVKMDRKRVLKEKKRAEEEEEEPTTIHTALNTSVSQGYVGDLKVHRHFLYIEEIPDGRLLPTKPSGSGVSPWWITNEMKVYILIFVVGALLLTYLIQCICNMTKKNISKGSKKAAKKAKSQKKDRRMSGSYWREIAARANHAYQAYDSEGDTGFPPSIPGATLISQPTSNGTSRHHSTSPARQEQIDMFGSRDHTPKESTPSRQRPMDARRSAEPRAHSPRASLDHRDSVDFGIRQSRSRDVQQPFEDGRSHYQHPQRQGKLPSPVYRSRNRPTQSVTLQRPLTEFSAAEFHATSAGGRRAATMQRPTPVDNDSYFMSSQRRQQQSYRDGRRF